MLVILAILAAFTIPAMLGFIDDARGKAAIAEARELYDAAQASATELYPEYSGYDGGIRQYIDGDERRDCSFKMALADQINSKVKTDLQFACVIMGDNDTKNTPGGIQCVNGQKYSKTKPYPIHSFEVGLTYNETGGKFSDISNKQKMTSVGCAKIWFHAVKGDKNYNKSAEAFKVMAVQYTSQDGKYMVTILQDPTNRGVKTTVEKVSDILNAK